MNCTRRVDVYNLYVEMKVAGSEVEVLTNDGNWRKSKAHPWCEVGAFLMTSGVDTLQLRGVTLLIFDI